MQSLERNSSTLSVARRQSEVSGAFKAMTTRGNGGRENSDRTGPLGLTTLYRPPTVVVADIIFVHGLGGGSRKTWTKNADPSLFWPKEWLPQEPEFRNVRIHTFGYDSNWNRPSVLGIRDFATSLLRWFTDLPEIASDTEVCCAARSWLVPPQVVSTNLLQKPLILVCHSMGGLVAKEAYILAQESSQYSRFGSSLRSIFFLATPHRGADLAHMLSKILNVGPGTRPFVADLAPASVAIQAINETFPRYSDRLQLHSFFETIPMQIQPSKKELVVKQESAVMGEKYKNEMSTYLAADHRNVCKYESPESSNYRIVRNAIAASLKSLTASMAIPNRESFSQQQQTVNGVLGVSDQSEVDYMYDLLCSRRVEGSCEWITQRQAFRRWAYDEDPDFNVYWMTAKAGAGKSVLCAYLIKLLRLREHSPAFFFFGHEKKTKPSVSAFLRSCAAHVASSNPAVLENMCKICSRNPDLAEADAGKVWRKLFSECILKHTPHQRYYWIIDGLDECGERDTVGYIMQAARNGKFRIFVTSRTTPDSYEVLRPRNKVYADHIDETTTNSDIKLFLAKRGTQLATQDASSVYQQVLEKADGCFLHAKLALHELLGVSDHSHASNTALYNTSITVDGMQATDSGYGTRQGSNKIGEGTVIGEDNESVATDENHTPMPGEDKYLLEAAFAREIYKRSGPLTQEQLALRSELMTELLYAFSVMIGKRATSVVERAAASFVRRGRK
jgi:pimeloyl-ACP methyl ester carboxylesterase